MQAWQIEVLEWERTMFERLNEFIASHGLGVFIVLVYLVMAIGIGLIVLISRGQHRRLQQGGTHIPPVIFIEMPGPPSQPDTFDPFPPPHQYRHCDCDEHSNHDGN